MAAELTPDLIKDFVLAAHFNFDKVKAMLAENPGLLMKSHQWGENDFEDAIGAASHVGNRPIAEFLLEQGVPSSICTAAMLGNVNEVAAYLDKDPAQANATGAHRISLMFHAAMSGDTALTALLKSRGCTGDYNHALHAAINRGHKDMVAWLLDNGVTDLSYKDFQGKTPLKNAIDRNQTDIADLLRQRGAPE